MLAIDVYSDAVCPWCYVGLRRLDKALTLTALKETARVRWLPFELNPGLPPGGVERNAYMAAKFGTAQARAMEERIAMVGRFENIDFRFDRIVRQPNTFLAHRLIRWAERNGRQADVAEAVFRAHFTEGRDIGDPAALADLAAGQGLPREAAEAFLRGDELAAETRAEEAAAARAGIGFVPYFIVNGVHAIRGAEDAEVMAGVLREAAGPQSTQNA